MKTAAQERFVLACILNNPDKYWEVAAVLDPVDFSLGTNTYVYGAIRQLMEADKDIDISSIHNSFPTNVRKALDKETNGDVLRYLDALKSSPHSVHNLMANVEEIKVNSVRRKLGKTLDDLKNEINKADVSHVSDFFDICDNELLNLSVESSIQVDDGQIGIDIEKIFDGEGEDGLHLGFKHLDKCIDGVAPGQLLVVVARPKQGKSALLLNWATRLVLAGYPCLYLDTEMSRREQQSRMVAIMTGIEEKRIKKMKKGNYCTPQEMRKVESALEILQEAPFYHLYVPGFTTEAVVNLARKYKVMKNIQVLFFDYIKLPNERTDNPEWLQLGIFTDALKNKIAGKLEMPVVTAAQLNRLAVQADDFESDQIGGSDRILHLCNYLLAMRRKTDDERKKQGKSNGNVLLKLAYARDSEDGLCFNLNFNKPTLTITEVGVTDGEWDESEYEATYEQSGLEEFAE